MSIKPKRFAYLAGLVDGDGSITIRYNDKSGYQLTLSVYSTSRSLMKFLVLHFGGQFRNMPTEGNRKQKYCWYTNSPYIITGILPYSIIKIPQVILAAKFIELGTERIPEKRNDLCLKLQAANQYFIPVKDKFHIQKSVEPSKLSFATLAGLLDSEGSFSIYKRKRSGNGKYTSYIRFSNTDARPFPWLMNRFGGRFSPTLHLGARTEGTWTMSGINRERFLLATIPYLVVKREQAILLLEWIRANKNRKDTKFTSDQREAFYQKLKLLNERGLSSETNTLERLNKA